LPAGFGRPILLVMHVATPFDVSLADWLDAQSSHRVALAVDGMPLPSEGVTLAPAGLHMIVEGGRVRLSDASERHSCKPSIDVLFESLASERGAHTAAALLTGMGKDGAAGLLAIRHAGGRTVAQDERTSVVYGMPRAAFELGAAEAVLPIERIGEQLSEWGGHG
jgi:two-component system chemotaxis response regulator CheB